VLLRNHAGWFPLSWRIRERLIPICAECTGGLLIKFDPKTKQLSEFRPPTPNLTFYECMPDRNGEIRAGGLYAGRIVRYNPRTDRWTEYMLHRPSRMIGGSGSTIP
jgi:streptogramin lyase